MKCHQRFTFFSFLPTFANILVIVAIVFAQPRRIPTKKTEYLSEPRKLKFQLDIKKGCDYISFPNATINDCGYCVGGATGLEANFGKDCLGVCFGHATVDCRGVCDGRAVVDECTGVCLTPGKTSVDWSNGANRDCRGLCAQPTADLSGSAPMPSQAYTLDQCGICRMSQASFSMSSSVANQPVDCNGECQLPGMNKSSIRCGQCVRPSEVDSVLDDCGNCISEGHPCSCDRHPTRCGCIDPNNCYLIKTLSPGAIPIQVQVNVSIVGYFYPYAKQLFCVVRRQGFETVESFPVHFLHKNKTVVECAIQLAQESEYVLGLGFRKNVFITPPKDLLHLYAFNPQSVNLSLIGPAKSFSNESESPLTIDFADLMQDIPPIPIRCKVIFESGKSELANFGNKPNSCILRKSSLRSKSQKLKIYPTFDGVNLMPTFLEHTIEATAPAIFGLSSLVSEDGLSIVVNFDKSVDLGAIEANISGHTDEIDEPLVMCDYLLHERTIEHLSVYGLQGCRWATRVQLIITILRPLSTDSVEIEVKANVLQEFDQRYPLPNAAMSANVSRLSSSLNWWSYEPMLTIVGPSEVPSCGEFALIGLFSSPRGTHEVDFTWQVSGEASAELKQYVTRTGKSTNLILITDMFESGNEYTFTFKAFIQARRQTLESSHTLMKHDFEAPLLSLYHTRLLHNLPLYESDNITLLADVKVSDCISTAQRLILAWKTEDPQFRFPLSDLKKRFSISYTIDPYSVPPNHSTSLMVNSFLGLYQNHTSSAVYKFEMAKAPLKSNLMNGINKMTIGSQSGVLHLTSGAQLHRRVIYQWSCHETKTAQPCYFNFGSVPVSGHNRNPLLFTAEMHNQKELYLQSTWFIPNQQYLIGLQVFDANNSKASSETEYLLLNVEAGNKPQVSIGPVYIHGKYAVPYNTRFSTFIIPFGTSLSIRGRAFLQSGIQNVRWESTGFRYPLNWSKKQVNGQQIDTELRIHDDSLMAYGVYTFKLYGCNHQNECSSSEISLMAANSVTMCNVQVDSYIELELSMVNVEKCNIPPSASPVTFQLYLEDENFPTLLPVNGPQLSPVILFAGTPAFRDNQLSRLAVRVCDRFDTCTVHFSQPISVENAPNLTASVDSLVQRAHRFYKMGDTVTALSVTNSIVLKPDTLNESYPSYQAAINATIEFAAASLQMPNLTLTKGHYEMIVNALSFSLLKTNNYRVRRKLLALIVRFFDKAEAMQSLPSINAVRVAYSNVMNAFVVSEEMRASNVTLKDTSYLRDIRATFQKIKKAAASQLPLGSRLVLVAERLDERHLDSEGLPVRLQTAITEIVHLSNTFDVDLRALLSSNQTVTARVQFGEEVKRNLSAGWDCKQELPCSSVVYAVTLFAKESPFPDNSLTHRITPILDITLHAPRTGREQPIRGLSKAAVFELTVTGNSSYGGPNYSTKCHYFDEKEQLWRMDDVHPLGIAYGAAGCWTGHFSSFVVLRTDGGLGFDIIGVIAACLMGVIIFGTMMAFYVHRKREEAAVTPEAHKPAENAAANGHHMHQPRQIKPRIRPSQVATEIQSKTILVTD